MENNIDSQQTLEFDNNKINYYQYLDELGSKISLIPPD